MSAVALGWLGWRRSPSAVHRNRVAKQSSLSPVSIGPGSTRSTPQMNGGPRDRVDDGFRSSGSTDALDPVFRTAPSDAAGAAVEVTDLVKRYPKAPKDSLAGVSFQVRQGEVFGFLGPNGAGKTTTIGILTTRIRPTSGRALVAGVDVVADPVGARRLLGVVPQINNLDRSLSVRQNLLFHASYHGVPRADVRTWPMRCSSSSGCPTGRAAGRTTSRGTDPTDDDRPGADALPRRPLPRRAVDRPRPGRPPVPVGEGGRAPGCRDDGGDHHARHGRGCRAQRPRGHHRPRNAPGPRHPRPS